MNPPRAPAPSRFVRGRGRGGGAYRPYFYFKRNGRTIPAHGRGANNTNTRGRGAVGPVNPTAANTNLPNRLNNVPTLSAINSSFLQAPVYAAPEDRQQRTQSLEIEVPPTVPGWRLYFYKEPFNDTSDLLQRVKHMETHFKDHVAHYDYLNIQKKGHFELKANIVSQDEHLKENWPTLMQELSSSPLKTLAIVGLAMHSLATSAAIDESLSQPACTELRYVPKVLRPRKIYVRPTGFIAEGGIACISSLEIDQLYCVRGRVREIGPVDAAASWVAYKCTRCRQEQALKQTGYHPSRPNSCKRQSCLAKQGFIELRSSPFTHITPKQTIRLTEARLDVIYDLEQDSNNYIDVELKYDLVDTIYLGQEIIVTGALKIRPLQDEQKYDQPSTSKGSMEIYLQAVSIVDAKYSKYKFTEKDLEAITMINGEEDSFKLLVHSLAPEVHGHELIKAGALLSLIGGAGSQVHDEEEINILLVGDPGVGKSNIAYQCSKISQKGCLVQAKRGNTTTTSKLTHSLKGRTKLTLESGALFSSTNGHCSIDDVDRLASQQECLMNVLQSKLSCLAISSLCTTMHTPTSVIGTANTVSGHYDHSKLLTENIRINPSLLSEFHLVFLMLDKPNKEMDKSLTEHVRALHAGSKRNTIIANKFEQKPKTNNSMNMTVDDDKMDIDEDYNIALRLKLNPIEELDMDLLPTILLKKFIAYSRQQVKPLFIPESAEALKKFYLELRQQSANSTMPISSGHLAGLMRLCQARARIDFSSEVTIAHVRDIISMVRQSNADMAVGDYVDTNPASALTSGRIGGGGGSGSQANLRRFIQMLQMRSSALARRIFDFDELKDMARRVGIHCGVTNLIDIVNLQGILLKKGPNMYEVMMD
ncbi:DNA replication licensing factor REC [Lucilia cuprina]|uniref:DNA replication licensing factor REC n=1 Tax=Lucilia cuprina TaxID=7375 RepID=UPI001F06CF17|nr:DNA replication licensing factor REC [Lucilia cuprina]